MIALLLALAIHDCPRPIPYLGRDGWWHVPAMDCRHAPTSPTEHCNTIPNAQGGLWFGPLGTFGVNVVGSYYDVDVAWSGQPVLGTVQLFQDFVDPTFAAPNSSNLYARVWSLHVADEWRCVSQVWSGILAPFVLVTGVYPSGAPQYGVIEIVNWPNDPVLIGLALYRETWIDHDDDGVWDSTGHALEVVLGDGGALTIDPGVPPPPVLGERMVKP